jgi:hypothetical protein
MLIKLEDGHKHVSRIQAENDIFRRCHAIEIHMVYTEIRCEGVCGWIYLGQNGDQWWTVRKSKYA